MPKISGYETLPEDEIDDDTHVLAAKNGRTVKVRATDLHGEAAAAVADDVKKQGGTDINRIVGANRVPFIDDAGAEPTDGAAPPKGGAWTYSPRGGVNGLRAKKPVPPGHWDIEDFGGAGDYLHGRTVTAAAASPNITLSSTTGLFVGQRLRLNHAVTRTVQSITNGTDAVLTANAGVTCTGQPCYTDNADAYTALIATAEGLGPTDRGIAIHFAGVFYFSDTLHVRRGTMLCGVGHSDENKKPASMLVFDGDVDGLWFHAATFADDPSSLATYSTVYDITIYCRSMGTTGHGAIVRCPVLMQNVLITGFGQNGIDADADTSEGTGNASACRFFGVRSGSNGWHGIHFRGGDTGSCSTVGCSFPANGGWGVYDESGLGNYFAGVHCEGNTGNPCCNVQTTSGSDEVSVTDANLLWFDVAYTSLDLGVEVPRTGSRISIAGVSGTKEVLDIAYETRTATVVDASNTSPIVIETSAPHPYIDGDTVNITGVVGNTSANVGQRPIDIVDATHFSLRGTTGNGAYVSGGAVKDFFPSAVVTLDSTCDASVEGVLISNEDGRNHDFAATGPLTSSMLVGCYSEAALNKIDTPSEAHGGLLGQTQHVGTGHVTSVGSAKGAPFRYVNTRGAADIESALGANNDQLDAFFFGVTGGDYYTLRYNSVSGRWTFMCDASAEYQVLQLPTPVSSLRANGPIMGNGFFLSARKIAAANVNMAFVQAANRAPIAGEGTWARGDVVVNDNPAVGQPVGWSCTVAGDPGTWVAWANL